MVGKELRHGKGKVKDLSNALGPTVGGIKKPGPIMQISRLSISGSPNPLRTRSHAHS